jgi:hypothetical protein
MRAHFSTLGPRVHELIGAWLVCLIVATGCFTLLAAASSGRDGRPAALISPDPTATVAAAKADRAAAHRAGAHQHGRC